MIHSLGVDVGGTFTDLFVIDKGKEHHIKSPTTKEDPSIGVMNAIIKSGIDLSKVENVIHGCTIATNAIIERKYDDTAFITTKGFRDILEIGHYHREELYNPYLQKPGALVPRKLRFEVKERIRSNGDILVPLDEGEAEALAKKIIDLGVKNVAIGFVNSYKNNIHELKMEEILRRMDPDIMVATSSKVLPKIRLLGRFNLTVINAALQSLIGTYITHLEKVMRENGFRGNLWMIQSNGGMIRVDQAADHSEMFLLSGPSAGVAATCFITKNMGITNAVTMDMGGTSCDIALVENNEPVTTTGREIAFDVPVPIPMIDVTAIGAGGGSIAWVDRQGILKVGPQSAGASPGPAFYGRKAGHFTISDANLLLGYIHPKAFMAGEIAVDKEGAIEAAHTLGKKMNTDDLIKIAKGVVTVANNNMAHALSETLIKKGRDPREFTLIAFGGAGALHATAIARILKVPKVVIPIRSSVFCAFGATLLDARHDFYETLYTELENLNISEVEVAFERMAKSGVEILASEGFINPEIKRFAEVRYVGQSYELEVPLSNERINIDEIARDFEELHERLYGVKIDNNPIAIVSLHTRAIGMEEVAVLPEISKEKEQIVKDRRMIYLIQKENPIEAGIIDGMKLSPGDMLAGPAVVEYPTTTILIESNCEALVDKFGSIVITLEK